MTVDLRMPKLREYVERHEKNETKATPDFNFDCRMDNVRSYYGKYIIPPQIQRRVAIDLGSNVGLFSHQFSYVFDKIYAIDASYQNFMQSLTAASLLSTSNVFCFNLAAAKDTGKIIKIYRNDINGNSVSPVTNPEMISRLHKKVIPRGTDIEEETMKMLSIPNDSMIVKKIEGTTNCQAQIDIYYDIPWSEQCESYHNVFTISLEGLYDFFGLDYIDFLKVDIEGSEFDFLLDKDLSRIGALALEMHGTLGEELKVKLKSHLSEFFDVGIVHYDNEAPGHSEILYVSKELNKTFLSKENKQA